MLGAHLLADAVGAEARHRAAHEQAGLVDGVTQVGSRVAQHDQVARLGHEGAHVTDVAAHHDGDALHGDAAAGRGVALDDHQAAVARRPRRLAGVAGDAHRPRHDVLGQAGTGVAVHGHGGLLVHARAVVAPVALDGDRQRGVEAGPQGVRSLGVVHGEGAAGGLVECPVDRPDAAGAGVQHDGAERRVRGRHSDSRDQV